MARKKKVNALVPVVVLLLLVILGGAGLYIYKTFFYKPVDTRHLGRWERELDITDYTKKAMDIWLDGAALDDGTDYGDTKVCVTLVLTMNEDGSWNQHVDEASYDRAAQTALILAADGLRDFLLRRITSTNVNMEDVGKSVDELIEEAIDMTVEEYLLQYGPALLPPISDLKAAHNIQGTCSVENGVMTRSYKGASGEEITLGESYIIDERAMVFTGATYLSPADYGNLSYPILYTKIPGADTLQGTPISGN